jgi:hypothetical protein
MRRYFNDKNYNLKVDDFIDDWIFVYTIYSFFLNYSNRNIFLLFFFFPSTN